MTTTNARISRDLAAARDAMRRLLGDQYPAAVEPCVADVRAFAAAFALPVAVALPRLLDQLEADHMHHAAVLLTMAAGAEAIERDLAAAVRQ